MKRKGHIYSKICDINNIKDAIIDASKKKTKRPDVNTVLTNIDEYSKKIQNMMITETYIPSPYNIFQITEGPTHKQRIIYSPKFFPDQIIHRLLINQTHDVLMRGLYCFSCASIKHRGIHYGKKYLERWLRTDIKNTKYCFKMDIKKFFPSINKNILKKLVSLKIKDIQVLNLINIIIDSVDSGIPIGNYTSIWFANLYLEKLDHFIKEDLKVAYYIRYMDDIVIFGNNKKKLHTIKNKIEIFLDRFYLNIKNNWQIFRVDDENRGIDFLGFRFFRNKTILRRSLMLNISKKAKLFYKNESIKNSHGMISYYGWIYNSNSYNFEHNRISPYANINKCKNKLRL